MMESTQPRISVLIPCYNEEQTVRKVVEDFRRQLPKATIYVYDNNSTDRTVAEAQAAGAVIRYERRQGKGHVLRTMLRDVEADIYVMVDGDATYPAERVEALIQPILHGEADMVVGSRLQMGDERGFKWLNRLGNMLFRFICNRLFRVRTTDLLTGYRAMNRRVAKWLPFFSHGFEIETELTVRCLVRDYRVVEIPVRLVPRPAGSVSKIRVFEDGWLILNTLLALARDYKPLLAFGTIGAGIVLLGCVPGAVVIREYLLTRQVLRMPSAVFAVGCVLAGCLVMFTGVALHAIARRFQELSAQLDLLLERTVGPEPPQRSAGGNAP